MTSRTDLEVFRAGLSGLSIEAQEIIQRTMEGLSDRPAREALPLLKAVLPDVVQTFGAAAASLAADYYDDVRATAGVAGDFAAEALDTVPSEQILASSSFATKGVYTDGADLLDTSGAMMKVVDRLTKKPGRDTLYTAGLRDPNPPRYARVPRGAVTCRFCAMLASRGAVYASAATAGEHKDFHDHCDCAVSLIFDGQALPEGYDPDHYLDVYRELGGASIDLGNESRTGRVATA